VTVDGSAPAASFELVRDIRHPPAADGAALRRAPSLPVALQSGRAFGALSFSRTIDA
jgi:hypothetical protein